MYFASKYIQFMPIAYTTITSQAKVLFTLVASCTDSHLGISAQSCKWCSCQRSHGWSNYTYTLPKKMLKGEIFRWQYHRSFDRPKRKRWTRKLKSEWDQKKWETEWILISENPHTFIYMIYCFIAVISRKVSYILVVTALIIIQNII